MLKNLFNKFSVIYLYHYNFWEILVQQYFFSIFFFHKLKQTTSHLNKNSVTYQYTCNITTQIASFLSKVCINIFSSHVNLQRLLFIAQFKLFIRSVMLTNLRSTMLVFLDMKMIRKNLQKMFHIIDIFTCSPLLVTYISGRTYGVGK